MCVVYIRWDAVKVVLSFRHSPLFLARVVSSRLFFLFSPFSTFHFFRVSPLALGVCVYIPSVRPCIQGEVSFAGPRYIYEEPLPLMVSMCSDATRTCPVRSACAHTRAWSDSSCVRARACSVRTRVHVPDPATPDTVRREDEEGFTHTHTRTSRTGVNYASREMSNCSPYHKIYNSARCGKHYVLSRFFSSPPWSFYLQPPGVPTVHPPIGPSFPSSRPRFSPPRGHHDSQINSRGTPQSY